ncbi:hypothetical protein RHMOL_Rhmol09G0129300 [Rhododendron molle]|uniref:Uncharacterized protein n=1 Tax=Rhododendron molle TaxID=49168 RepID=A0ACC0MEG8_RHOML|nr:hypothetical protein RHMOL_Rhmol09G0129300 [Rhododendron molle]
MATQLFEPCTKTRKRKTNLFGSRTFPCRSSTVGFSSPFRESVRLFLKEFAEISEHSVAGWGHHFVPKRWYHVIIPAGNKWDKPLKGSCLENRGHLLYGLIHCNGFGHLLCISGVEEEASNCIPIVQIMDLWDRICTTLQTRKISTNDASERSSMELRLLYGVAYGQSWFGKWGYKFGRGSYGVTEDQYNKAINTLSTLDLNKIMAHFKNNRQGRVIHQIINRYRGFSETELVTISDLLQFMLDFKSRANNSCSKHSSRKTHQCGSPTEDNPISIAAFVSSLGSTDCRWPPKRLENAIEVIFNLLNGSTDFVMSLGELRDGARQCIGDAGLIDYVLKSIECLAAGDQIVRRSVNPSTKLVDFTINHVAKRTDSSSESESATFLSSVAKFDSRWPPQRLEHVAKVVWNILREVKGIKNGKTGLSRQELRDFARQFVGDTGLIDYVLKSIHGSIVGNQIVRRSRNPSTKTVEFSIQDIVDRSEVEHVVGLSGLESAFDVDGDVLFLYKNVLLGYPESNPVSSAARTVLVTKHFVKEWEIMEKMNDHLMTLTCRVLPSFDELETELTRPLPPGELVVVPPWITIGELRVAAQCALRDTYCIMDRFDVRQIGGLRGIEDGRVLSCVVEPGAQVWVRGCGLDLDTKLRYEGGPGNRTVDCVCGARDDDGERTVTCDGCHVGQHTRCCCGIEDDEPAPSSFLCRKCRG